MTAVNICYGEEEKRGFVSFNLHALALGAGLALFGIAALALVAVLPAALALLPVSDAWGDLLGLVRWPLLAGIVTLALAIVYRYAPDRAEPKWQWISWGSGAATTLWILGSIAFTTYVSKVGSYDKTYGSLGAVIILLLWFYHDRLRHPRRGGTERGDRAPNHACEARSGTPCSLNPAVTAARPRRAAEGIINCSSLGLGPRVGASGSYIGSKWEF